jgi:signal transduction histidine kinase
MILLPVSIRSRLLLLVMAVLLPAMVGAGWLLARSLSTERDLQQRSLSDRARSLSRTVDREVARRAAIARVIALSPLLSEALNGDSEGLADFERSAMLPYEFQALVEELAPPAGWVATIRDSRQQIVARYPADASLAGPAAGADAQQQLQGVREGFVESESPDGAAFTGFFVTSAHGWTCMVAMPRQAFIGNVRQAVVPVSAGAGLLLIIALGAASLMAQKIAGPASALKRAANRLQAGEKVERQQSGVAEYDEVGIALAEASHAIHQSRTELEQRVAQAVVQTRDAEQQVARSRRLHALGRLTGGVAHDVNNLLGVISNSAHLMQHHAIPPQKAALAAIFRAVQMGGRLTQHLLRFAARQPGSPQVVALDRLLPELEDLLRSVLGPRVAVRLEVAPGTSKVHVDPAELEMALINLALNARDAMPLGGSLWLRARNAAPNELMDERNEAHCVLIEVTDDGVGMSEEQVERAFEPFYTTKGVGKGTGLGLAQVHGFAQQAGGRTWVRSAAAGGTTVSLLLPALRRETPEPVLPQPALPLDRLKQLRVLLAEDNVALAEVTTALLEGHGCQVVRAGDANEALKAFALEGPFDAVLSDVVMPGDMDGLELARRLREQAPELPVVLTSGYAPAAAAQDIAILSKPYTEHELLIALLRATDGLLPPPMQEL